MSFSRVAVHLALVIAFVAMTSTTSAQSNSDESVSELINRASKIVNSKQKYHLAYKMKKGQELRWTVEHVASTKTQIAGESEATSSRSQSTKLWKVSSVDSLGNMTFVHTVESVNLWQRIGEAEPVTYNSLTDKEVPLEYDAVTSKIGKPLAVITVSPEGQVLDRKTSLEQAHFGVGDITTPLPSEDISIGYKWFVPTTFTAKDEEGRNQQLKARIQYELSNVSLPNAFISFRTEVLTPIQSDKVRSQIMQQLTKGYIVFDIDLGLPVRKEVEWDEKVQGYEGPDSYLNYVGKLTEKYIVGNSSAPLAPVSDATGAPPAAKVSSQADIKPRSGKPIMRK
jgi:hypothetical protein